MDTNYYNSFITASPDCPVVIAVIPDKAESIAGVSYALLYAHPYRWTSDELLFEIYARRFDVSKDDRDTVHAQFAAKSQACLRTSPLVKRYGWGLHHDVQGRVALYALGSADYDRLSKDRNLKIIPGIRSSRVKL